jgi:regulator of extracellular matrix RemA (YlzA/DUF370 family)
MKMINLGYKHFIPAAEVFAIVPYRRNKSVKLQVECARENNLYLDFTYGNGRRSVIFLKNGFVIISGIKIDTLNRRFSNNAEEADEEEEE